ncbi:hypothetical protein ACFXHA_07130 [Nocardia sp. NPDC059240]|uniref:hypothetical protein n=1 Tax=Nocardia sp. NPDC059240 TaxID=3346786 RepID=UPI00369F71ED
MSVEGGARRFGYWVARVQDGLLVSAAGTYGVVLVVMAVRSGEHFFGHLPLVWLAKMIPIVVLGMWGVVYAARQSWRRARVVAVLGLLVLLALAVVPTVIIQSRFGSANFTGYLPFPTSIGYLLARFAITQLALVALLQIVPTVSILRRGEPGIDGPGRVGAWLRTSGVAVLAAGMVAAVTAVSAGSLHALDVNDTAAVSNPPINRLPMLDLSRTFMPPIDRVGKLGSAPAGPWAIVTEPWLGWVVGIDPRSGKSRWEVRRAGWEPRLHDSNGVGDQFVNVAWYSEQPTLVIDTDTGVARPFRVDQRDWAEYPPDRRNVRVDPRTGRTMWTFDPTTIGCAARAARDYSMHGGGVVLYECRQSSPASTDPHTDQTVAALDADTGQLLWKRSDLMGFAMTAFDKVAGLETGDGCETVDARTGATLGHFPRMCTPASLLRDGHIIDSPSETPELGLLSGDFQFLAPDAKPLWSAQIPDGLRACDWASTGNQLLMAWRRDDHSDCGDGLRYEFGRPESGWVVAFDLTDGHRTVVAGPGPLPDGENPILTMDVAVSSLGGTLLTPQSWGVAIPGRNGTFAIIPAR